MAAEVRDKLLVNDKLSKANQKLELEVHNLTDEAR